MAFDYGVESKEIGGGCNIKIWPTEGKRTALVDADAIAYVVGYTSNLQQYLRANRSGEFYQTRVWADKKDHANFILNKWVTAAGCDSAKLYLTDGSSNFRLKIAKTKEYKGQRMSEKPPFFYEIRNWLSEEHNAIMSVNCEADDMISIEAWKRIQAFDSEPWTMGHRKFSDFVVVSGDKDLGIIPTWRCPPGGKLEWVDPLGELTPVWREKDVTAYEYWPLFVGQTKDLGLCEAVIKYQGEIQIRSKHQLQCPKPKWELDYVWFKEKQQQDTYARGVNKGKGKFKRVKVGTKKSEYMHKLRGVGLKFFYSQVLSGDNVDNYPGLPGCGEVKAYAELDSATTEYELVSRVRHLYIEHYGETEGEERMIEQGQLAWMQTKEGELWLPPSSKEQSFPR